MKEQRETERGGAVGQKNPHKKNTTKKHNGETKRSTTSDRVSTRTTTRDRTDKRRVGRKQVQPGPFLERGNTSSVLRLANLGGTSAATRAAILAASWVVWQGFSRLECRAARLGSSWPAVWPAWLASGLRVRDGVYLAESPRRSCPRAGE